MHTKGPWTILVHSAGTNELVMILAGDMRIANMHSAKDRNANAHLIAAAPDLLEACKVALARLRESFDLSEFAYAVMVEIQQEMAHIEAAIRRATLGGAR